MGRYFTAFVVLLCFLEPPPGEEASPHYNGNQCADCHGRDLPGAVREYGGRKALFNALCLECHPKPPTACRFHCGTAPSEASRKRFEPLMPLKGGKFYCLTCHDARIQCVGARAPEARRNPRFLRGNPKGPVSRFCFACHRAERFRYLDVHEHADEACLYCHDEKPPLRGEGKRSLEGLKVRVCRSCHAPFPHPGGRDHTALEREGEPITCQTCHDPHARRQNGRDLLRAPDREALCRACHGDKLPKKDSK